MNKISKIFLIGLLIFTFTFSFYNVKATSSDSSSSQEDAIDDENITTSEETPSTGLSTLSSTDITSVSPMNSYSEANLELNNILNIILISIGVVLILFAIAILIRLKN
jgi:hypothetical protein